MNTENAPDLITEKYKSPAVCEACGAEFGCGAERNSCWCMDVELTEKTREQLREDFKNCLCRNCLEKFDSAEK